MLSYWILLGIPIVGQICSTNFPKVTTCFLWYLMLITWTLVITFRYQIGCDWEPYAAFYESIDHLIFTRTEYLATGQFWPILLESAINWDISYTALNLIASLTDTGVFGVNLICALLCVIGLSTFCRHLPYPWLAWFVATPYFLIVLTLGYVRQATAIAILMWGLTQAHKSKQVQFILSLALALSFHKWSILVGLAGLQYRDLHRYYVYFLITIFVIAVLFLDSITIPTIQYIFSTFNIYNTHLSYGTVSRGLLNVLPAILFLFIYIRYPQRINSKHHFWIKFYLASILLFTVSLVFGQTNTTIDRIGLYFLPTQIFFWSWLPSIFETRKIRIAIVLFVTAMYTLVLFSWINFSTHANCWFPYQNILFPNY